MSQTAAQATLYAALKLLQHVNEPLEPSSHVSRAVGLCVFLAPTGGALRKKCNVLPLRPAPCRDSARACRRACPAVPFSSGAGPQPSTFQRTELQPKLNDSFRQMLCCARVGVVVQGQGLLLRCPHFCKQAEYPLELFLEDLSAGRDAAAEAFACVNEPPPRAYRETASTRPTNTTGNGAFYQSDCDNDPNRTID